MRQICLEACGGSCDRTALAVLEHLGGTSVYERKATRQEKQVTLQSVCRNPDFRRIGPVNYKSMYLRGKLTGICRESVHGRDTAVVSCS